MGAGRRGTGGHAAAAACGKLIMFQTLCCGPYMSYLHEPRRQMKFVLILFSIFMDKQEKLIEVICSSGGTEIQTRKFHAFKV